MITTSAPAGERGIPMTVGEFELIARFFAPIAPARADVDVGIGDDAAVLRVPPDRVLVVTTDTLIAGVHFGPDAAPETVGHKCLAVNLSDLAAMGADAAWVTLALTLPVADEAWLAGFAAGFSALAQRCGVALVGGDTTRGPLSVTVQALGLAAPGMAVRRSGARAGDRIYVTGCLGDAALALEIMNGQRPRPDAARMGALRERLERPFPRVAEGRELPGLASAAIDVSDGLLADLGHLLRASGVGATLELEQLPLSRAYRELVRGDDPWEAALTGGDDYELCFTAAAQEGQRLGVRLAELGCPVTAIGTVQTAPGLRCLRRDGSRYAAPRSGYEHFGPNA